ncbi:MFS transporter [Streptomyces sp. NPDC006997]|uniref:MFS transporter n=1 Tax=Streptomyces sp. NPDC006997 TaxID=3155356 RepID=UPI0034090B7F
MHRSLPERPGAHGRTPSRPGPGRARTGASDGAAISAIALGLLATPTALSANATTMTLPDIARDIGVSVSTATWLATVFGLAVAVSTPLTAALLRHRGVRVAVLTSAALVAVGTLTVALAESMPGLLAGRAAQALGGSGFVTTAITLAGTPRRMAVITAGSGMCGALGPLSGSLLTDGLSWHVALALSAVALLAVPHVARRAPTPRPRTDGTAFDGVGAALSVALICSLVLLARFPVPALTGTAVLGATLALWVRRRPDGFLPVAVLRSPVFLPVAGVVCALSTAYFAILYTVPRLLEDDAGWDAVDIGVGSLVALLVGSAASWGMAAHAHRMGRSAALAVLLTLGVLAPVTAAAGSAPGPWLAAAGVAVFVAASGQAILALVAGGAVPERQRTTALGLFTLCYQLGGAFGPAIAALLLA